MVRSEVIQSGRFRFRAARMSSALFLCLSFFACSKIFSGSDITGEIASHVEDSTAENVNISIVSSPVSGGALSLSGSQVEKVGVLFPLSATAFSGYAFTGWSATGSGKVSFSSMTSTTNVAIATAASDIVITANYVLRPTTALGTFPLEYDHETIGTDDTVSVAFSEAMDPASFTKANITIQGKTAGSTSDYADIFSDFALAYDNSTNILTFAPVSSATLDSNYKVVITISSNVHSTTGITMSDDFQFDYTTGTYAKKTS